MQSLRVLMKAEQARREQLRPAKRARIDPEVSSASSQESVTRGILKRGGGAGLKSKHKVKFDGEKPQVHTYEAEVKTTPLRRPNWEAFLEYEGASVVEEVIEEDTHTPESEESSAAPTESPDEVQDEEDATLALLKSIQNAEAAFAKVVTAEESEKLGSIVQESEEASLFDEKPQNESRVHGSVVTSSDFDEIEKDFREFEKSIKEDEEKAAALSSEDQLMRFTAEFNRDLKALIARHEKLPKLQESVARLAVEGATEERATTENENYSKAEIEDLDYVFDDDHWRNPQAA